MLLTILAVFSIFGDGDQTPAGESTIGGQAETEPVGTADGQTGDDPSGPDRPYPGSRLQIDDEVSPLSIGCFRDRTVDDLYLIVVHNQGQVSVDYLVRAELTDDDGRTVSGLATVEGLQPDEEREVVLVPDDTVDGLSQCSIRAIQSDRRVLLAS